MKVLVTGGSGLLGKYLARAKPDGIEASFTWYTVNQKWCLHQLDVADQSQVGYVFGRVKPDAVIHMGAEGSVDRCEKDYTVADRTNVRGTINILQAAREHRAHVLLTSTNAVFSGEDPPYGPDSERKPVNAYGLMRKRAENRVMKHPHGWQVVRLFLLYGWEPKGARGNWASTVVRKLKAGEPLQMVSDVIYMPTYAGDAAIALWDLLLEGKEGVYHVAGNRSCSLAAFAQDVAWVWGLDMSLISDIRFSDLPDIAPRPMDTSYERETLICCPGPCNGLLTGPREGLLKMRNERKGT